MVLVEVLNKLNNIVKIESSLNEMKVKHDKVLFIVFNRQSTEHSLTFNVGESILENQTAS